MLSLEDIAALRTTDLERAGWLQAGARNTLTSGGLIASVAAREDNLRVTALTEAGEPVIFRLVVERLPALHGGSRPVFCCPQCARRTVALYWYRDAFSCRFCAGLLYRSQQWSSAYTHRQRVEDLLERAGTDSTPDIFVRPKGVWGSTWSRVLAEVKHKRTAALA